jgi:hypothetical protein
VTAPTDKPTISHSQIQSWRGCQQRWDYAYRQKLVSKRVERPLTFGLWMHKALETHYGPEQDWRVGYAENLALYDKLFDEEKLKLDKGKSKKKSDDRADFEPLSSQVERSVKSYVWYNRKERQRTIAVEVEFHLDMGDYYLHGFIDRIYEDLDTGLIIVQDHKTVDDLPDESAFHTMDPQTTIYFRGAQEALGVQAQAVEFNYIWSSAPSFPSQNQNGSISKSAISTDYPTLRQWLDDHGFDAKDYTDLLVPLYKQSPFLRRYRLPRQDLVTNKIIADADRSAHEILNHEYVIRDISRQCNWCPYMQVCRAELFGMDTTALRKNTFLSESERDAARAKRGAA